MIWYRLSRRLREVHNEFMRKLLGVALLGVMCGCGVPSTATSTGPTSAVAEQSTTAGEDVLATVGAYIAQELEAGTLQDACEVKDVTWTCNVKSITFDGSTLTVVLSKRGAAKPQGVASAFRNFLSHEDAPVHPAHVTVIAGREQATVDA